MVTIRLRRTGTTKRPTYRLIVSDRQRDTQGKYLESLGFYHPRSSPAVVSIDGEKVKAWLAKGAQASSTVFNLLVDHGVVPGPKRKSGGKGVIKDKAAADKVVADEAAAKVKADKETAAAAEEAAKAEAEKPAEEAEPEEAKTEAPAA